MSQENPQKTRIDSDIPLTPVSVHAQYVKDFSFENPGAPGSLRPANGKPEMDVNLVLDAVNIEEEGNPDLYEASLKLTVRSARDGHTLFISEIVYAALVTVKAANPSQVRAILYVEIPQLLFPFARQVIANAVTAGGFPPLLLSPIDFRGMYQSQNANRSSENAAA